MTVDRPAADDGEWWLDIEQGEFRTTVSWLAHRGFRVFLGDAGYGERPDEIYGGARLAALRLIGMAAAGKTGASPMGLGDIRRLLGFTQLDLGHALSVGQANVSRLEARGNVTLETLRSMVEAMGGEVELRVRFPSLDVPVALPCVGLRLPRSV